MVMRTIPNTDQQYYMVSFDKDGCERADSTGALDSDALVTRLCKDTAEITDVFFLAHGWKGDVPAAIAQYDEWLGAMHALPGGRERAEQRTGGFNPLTIGLHWPSQPWGDERVAGTTASGHTLGDDSIEYQTNFFTDAIADSDTAREAIALILAAPQQYAETGELPLEVHEAYDTLFRVSGLADDTELADLLGDQPSPWDAETIFQAALLEDVHADNTLAGGNFSDALLSPLRQMSFWKMKKRARKFGESGAARLLSQLMGVAGPQVRFHLMGHSFGCIVVSTAVQRAAKNLTTWRPVDSLFLVQGALSLWAFASEVQGQATPGYLHSVVRDAMVGGAIAATYSRYDHAVGKYYPIAARLGSQADLSATLPKYGGIGAFGMQGIGAAKIVVVAGNVATPYGLARGKLYNVEAHGVISGGDGASGAHSDIAHLEIAHLAWELVTLDS